MPINKNEITQEMLAKAMLPDVNKAEFAVNLSTLARDINF